ncbi:MAG: aminopeptidase P family protein [Bacteroidetes bacterium]|nr:aminopeptidase P family protein [Bacteroidota bacterium]
MFKSQTYINRRKQLKTDIKTGLILIPGNEESPMNFADNTYNFRQDSSFLYFFALDYPGLTGVIDIDNDKDYIFGNDLTIDDIVWMGTQASLKERSEKAGIENARTTSQLSDFLNDAKQKGRKIHFLPQYRADNKIKFFNWLKINPNNVNDFTSPELIQSVVNQRNIKTDEEIVEIEKAVNITVDMHLAAMRMTKPGISEAEVAAVIQQVAQANQGELSFPTIASIHGETLHNHYHGNMLKKGDMLLVDAGAENKMHYAGDMSSTIPVDNKFTTRQREIYNIALDAHMAAVNALKPGVKFKDIHILACKTIAQGMKNMGFMKGDIDEAVAQGAHAMFFPCGLGHMMGLDVHDMENLGEVYVGYDGKPKSTQFGIKSLRLARELQTGFVLTIEPGIYFIPELIDKWRAEKKFMDFLNYDKLNEYKNFGGLRNEEDYLITKDGARLLGKPLPKTIKDVENEKTK